MRSGALGLSAGDHLGPGFRCEQTLPCNCLGRVTAFCCRSQGPRRDQGQTPRGPCSAGGDSKGQQETNPGHEGVSPFLGAGLGEGPPAQGKQPQGVLSSPDGTSFSVLLSALTETPSAISGGFPVRQQGGDRAIVPSGTSLAALRSRLRSPRTGGRRRDPGQGA